MRYLANYWQPNFTIDITFYSNTKEVPFYLTANRVEKKKPETPSFSNEMCHPFGTFFITEFFPGKLKALELIGAKKVAARLTLTLAEVSKMAFSAGVSAKDIAPKTSGVVSIPSKLLHEKRKLVNNSPLPVAYELTSAENNKIIDEDSVYVKAGIFTRLLHSNNFTTSVHFKHLEAVSILK